jgi:hypothetical protein
MQGRGGQEETREEVGARGIGLKGNNIEECFVYIQLTYLLRDLVWLAMYIVSNYIVVCI